MSPTVLHFNERQNALLRPEATAMVDRLDGRRTMPCDPHRCPTNIWRSRRSESRAKPTKNRHTEISTVSFACAMALVLRQVHVNQSWKIVLIARNAGGSFIV